MLRNIDNHPFLVCQSKVKSIKATNDLEAPSPYISAPSCQLWSSRESLRKDLSRQHHHFSLEKKERKILFKKILASSSFLPEKKVEHKIFSCIKFNLRSIGLWKGMVKWERLTTWVQPNFNHCILHLSSYYVFISILIFIFVLTIIFNLWK